MVHTLLDILLLDVVINWLSLLYESSFWDSGWRSSPHLVCCYSHGRGNKAGGTTWWLLNLLFRSGTQPFGPHSIAQNKSYGQENHNGAEYYNSFTGRVAKMGKINLPHFLTLVNTHFGNERGELSPKKQSKNNPHQKTKQYNMWHWSGSEVVRRLLWGVEEMDTHVIYLVKLSPKVTWKADHMSSG